MIIIRSEPAAAAGRADSNCQESRVAGMPQPLALAAAQAAARRAGLCEQLEPRAGPAQPGPVASRARTETCQVERDPELDSEAGTRHHGMRSRRREGSVPGRDRDSRSRRY